MKNYKSIICVVAAVCLLGTAAFCGFRIYHYYAEVDEQTEAFGGDCRDGRAGSHG